MLFSSQKEMGDPIERIDETDRHVLVLDKNEELLMKFKLVGLKVFGLYPGPLRLIKIIVNINN